MANYKSIYTGQEIDAGIAKANTAIQDVSNKVDKTEGKGLSTNDFTTEEKTKLAGIDMSSKQDILVSGTNIKTINNQSILGSGNIEVGGGSSLPISFSATQPPVDGSVILWINAEAEEPSVFTAFTLSGTCTNLAVEDRTELSSRQYLAKATGTNSLYNIIGVKNGSTPVSKVELSSISMGTAGFLVVGCNLSASEQGDLSTLLLYGVGQGQNLGFEIPVRGTKQGQYTNNPTVEGSFSDTTKAYVFESRAVTDGFKVTATRVDTGELEVTWTYSNLHATYVPCFGFGRNTAGDINWYFKKVV